VHDRGRAGEGRNLERANYKGRFNLRAELGTEEKLRPPAVKGNDFAVTPLRR